MSLLRELLTRAISLAASDVHIKENQPCIFRVGDALTPGSPQVFTRDDVVRVAQDILPAHCVKPFADRQEVDFSFEEPDVGRFRVNIYFSRGAPTISMRYVKNRIPTFEELHLPLIMKQIALSPRGVVLLTGATGSGKSNSLAAMIQEINVTHDVRIITIENPIEYILQDQKACISQREIGIDTGSFREALRHVMRQDPDVIVIGEMRDAPSFVAAVTAAETGHLVFSSLHADTASQALPRILNFFPHLERDQVRASLAANLRAVICQRLVPAVGGGLMPAVEVLINTPAVRKLIERNNLDKLPAAIETGTEDGMQTFNQSFYRLIKGGRITEEDGLRRSDNAEALKMNLKGIFLDESRRILSA